MAFTDGSRLQSKALLKRAAKIESLGISYTNSDKAAPSISTKGPDNRNSAIRIVLAERKDLDTSLSGQFN